MARINGTWTRMLLLGLCIGAQAEARTHPPGLERKLPTAQVPEAERRPEEQSDKHARVEQAPSGDTDAPRLLPDKPAQDPNRALSGRDKPATDVSRSMFGMAERMLVDGDLGEASSILDRMSGQRMPTKIREEALFRKAEIAFFQGDFEQAIELSQALTQTFPEGFFVNDALKLAVLVEENGKPQEALSLFAQARLKLRQRNLVAADSILNRLVETFPAAEARDDALFLSSALSRDLGDYPEAIARCRNLLQIYPSSPLAPDARQRIARIYDEFLSQPEQALSEYERVLIDYPGSLHGHEARRQIGRLREKDHAE
ncbi:MAG: tetratricopeptide repeat protein [Candidatus Latescibacterota bacterium]